MSKRDVDSRSGFSSGSDSDSDSDPSPPSAEGTSARTKKNCRRLARQVKKLKKEVKNLEKERSWMRSSMESIQKSLDEVKNVVLQTRCEQTHPTSIQEGNIQNLKLQCKTKLAGRVFTGSMLVDQRAEIQGAEIQVTLVDANTNEVVTKGMESSVRVRAVVIGGDFTRHDNENWTQEEFDGYILKEREQKRPLLIGELHTTLREGVGSLKDLTFTDNSRWHRSGRFRIGVQVVPGYCEGTRIREALTESLTVLERRGEPNKKHYPPQPSDPVWRLECIGKDGKFHKKLNEERITNVEELLQAYYRDEQALRNILGKGMTTKKWSSLVEHALTCPRPQTGSSVVVEPAGSSQQIVVLAGETSMNPPPAWCTPNSDSLNTDEFLRLLEQEHDASFIARGNPELSS